MTKHAKDGTNKKPYAITDRGVELIKKWEGYVSVVEADPVGIPTGGWGHTRGVKKGQKVTKAQAEAWLREDIEEAAAIVDTHVKCLLNDEQRDALVSFVFNVGPGKKGVKDGLVELKRGGQSTLLKKLNSGDFEGAALEFQKWTRAKGEVLPGLVNRRNDEQKLFLKGTIQEAPLPNESNIEPTNAEPPQPVVSNRGVQATTAAAIGAVLTETAKQFEPFIQYGSFIQTIFIGLTICGLVWAAYGARKGT